MKKQYSIVILSILSTLFWLSPATAELCDSTLIPISDPTLGYKMRDARCEGFYRSNVSLPNLEVVSLLFDRLNFSRDTLSITAPQFQQHTVMVHAVGIPLQLYYRFDAELPMGSALPWSLTLLKQKNVRPEQIGVFGQLKDNPMIYIPLYTDQVPSSAPTEAVLLLRATVDVNKILWRYAPAAENRCQKLDEWRELNSIRGFMAGESIPFTLPVMDSPQLCLEVALQSRRGESWLKKLVKIQLR